MSLKIHCFQHVAYEDLGCITQWIELNNHQLSYSKFYTDYSIPEPEAYDWLIVMGGPMGIYDQKEFPWLTDEKKSIKKAIDQNKTVIGICLGSQLIADVLEEKVFKNVEKEIGWFPLNLTEISKTLFGEKAKDKIMVFHWHGDTYNLPKNAIHLASSEGCINQAFLYKDKVLGLQFHLEVTHQSLQEMIEHGRDELKPGKFIQAEKDIRMQTEFIETNNQKMFELLNHFYNKD